LSPSSNRRKADLAADVQRGLGVHQERDDKTVETQDFGENENQDHSNEETGLLGSSSDTGITNDTDSEASSKTGKTDGETGTKLNETSEKGELLREAIGYQDGDDETVNTNNTSHNDGHNV
jgi:hypothetical protein